MPAKKRITKEMIVEQALQIIRDEGIDGLNCKYLAQKLQCSTQPLYLSFQNMEELKGEVEGQIKRIYGEYLEREVKAGKYPVYKAYGMGYIRFAREEKEFFRYLFLRNRSQEGNNEEGESIREILSIICRSTGLSEDEAYRFHVEMWFGIHGVATMLATSFLDIEEKFISEYLTDLYAGLKYKYGVKA